MALEIHSHKRSICSFIQKRYNLINNLNLNLKFLNSPRPIQLWNFDGLHSAAYLIRFQTIFRPYLNKQILEIEKISLFLTYCWCLLWDFVIMSSSCQNLHKFIFIQHATRYCRIFKTAKSTSEMIFYEHFNTSNETAPYYQAHQSFVTNIKVVSSSISVFKFEIFFVLFKHSKSALVSMKLRLRINAHMFRILSTVTVAYSIWITWTSCIV